MRPKPIVAPGRLSCRELVELITDYLEDALPHPMRERFEQHLRGCEGCFAYLDQMRVLLSVLGHLREEWIAEPARGRLLDALAEWKRS